MEMVLGTTCCGQASSTLSPRRREETNPGRAFLFLSQAARLVVPTLYMAGRGLKSRSGGMERGIRRDKPKPVTSAACASAKQLIGQTSCKERMHLAAKWLRVRVRADRDKNVGMEGCFAPARSGLAGLFHCVAHAAALDTPDAHLWLVTGGASRCRLPATSLTTPSSHPPSINNSTHRTGTECTAQGTEHKASDRKRHLLPTPTAPRRLATTPALSIPPPLPIPPRVISPTRPPSPPHHPSPTPSRRVTSARRPDS